MITDFEKNKVWFSSLLKKRHPKIYKDIVEILDKHEIPHEEISGTRDIWCRDYMPVQVDEGQFVRFDYKPDYLTDGKYEHLMTDNEPICETLAENGGWDDPHFMNLPFRIKLDGGNVVSCDNKVIMIDKVFEENPQYSVRQLSSMLETVFNAEIVFLPWDPTEIYGHADGLVRYMSDGSILLSNYTRYNPEYVKRVRKILTAHFNYINELDFDVKHNNKYNWAYINWLQIGRVLILPKFNCEEDEQALTQIRRITTYRDRIERVEATALAKEGGCLNCATWTTAEVEHYKVRQ